MSNSPLVAYTRISPNKSSPRNHAIDTITIHCYVGQAQVEDMGAWFGIRSSECSSNYGIGRDGRIGLFVDEDDRSWCSSSAANDNRAVTIECASDGFPPFAVNDMVFNALIELCADICLRNSISELKWAGDPALIGQTDKQNMTVHRWFANKSCPGEYLYSRMGLIAEKVNEKIQNDQNLDPAYPDAPFYVRVNIDNLNIRKEASGEAEVVGTTGKGIFTIVDTDGDWGRLFSGAGWIWLGNDLWVTILESAKKPEFKPIRVRVDIDNLNIRTGPGVQYDTIGVYTGKGVFTIVEVINNWGRLKSGAGWICMDYVDII